MHLTWFGHSTWRVELGATTILIDPFFDNPKTESDPEAVDPDHVLITHGHADHIAHADRYRGAHFVATPEIAGYLTDEYGIGDTTGMNLGGTLAVGDAAVTMHRADHSNGIETGYGATGGMPAGYVISDTKPTHVGDDDAETFYHAGDTALMTEMREVIGPYLDPDAAALPIGDHFTMGPMQAAVAVDWLDVEYAFPIHYDTFPPIEQDPEDFRREVEATDGDAEVVILDADDRFDLTDAL